MFYSYVERRAGLEHHRTHAYGFISSIYVVLTPDLTCTCTCGLCLSWDMAVGARGRGGGTSGVHSF